VVVVVVVVEAEEEEEDEEDEGGSVNGRGDAISVREEGAGFWGVRKEFSEEEVEVMADLVGVVVVEDDEGRRPEGM
jgi:hypothetical protein